MLKAKQHANLEALKKFRTSNIQTFSSSQELKVRVRAQSLMNALKDQTACPPRDVQ